MKNQHTTYTRLINFDIERMRLPSTEKILYRKNQTSGDLNHNELMTLAYLANFTKVEFCPLDVSNPLRSSRKSSEKMGHKIGPLLIKNLKTSKSML